VNDEINFFGNVLITWLVMNNMDPYWAVSDAKCYKINGYDIGPISIDRAHILWAFMAVKYNIWINMGFSAK